MIPRSGTKIGNYQLIAPLSSGGFSRLWKAKHCLSKQIVAMKILNADANLKRVRNEARLQSSLIHPNIIKIYELIWMKKCPCIVMELINGWELNDYINKRKYSKSELLHLINQMLDAIQFLHRRKIIHRDLKPMNIMVQSDGQLKLLDFGIAKGWSSPNITKVGMSIGTPEYMAPERFNGMHSPQSDIWAVGLIIYELVTGKPFYPKMKDAAARSHFFEKSFIDSKLMGMEDPWKRVVSKCLQLQAKNRYKKVGDIAQDLTADRAPSQIAIFNPVKINARKVGIFLAGMAFITVVIFFGKYSISASGECNGTMVTYNLHPRTAILKTSRGELLKSGAWELCGHTGTKIQVTISAEGYLTKSFRYTFPQLNDNLTYVLEKKR